MNRIVETLFRFHVVRPATTVGDDDFIVLARPSKPQAELERRPLHPVDPDPVDLGHNFVLAHASCNGDKRDALAGVQHLEQWGRRLADQGA